MKKELAISGTFYIILSIAVSLLAENAKRHHDILITKVLCHYNTTVIQSFGCLLRNGSDHMNVIDAHIQLSTTVEDFASQVVVSVKRKNMRPITVFNVSVDSTCMFSKSTPKFKLLSVGLKAMRRFANAEFKCPFQKNFNYTMLGYYMAANDILDIMPEVDFIYTSKAFHDHTYAASQTVWGRVVIAE